MGDIRIERLKFEVKKELNNKRQYANNKIKNNKRYYQ